MLNLLTRHDRPLPTRAVKLMVENLTHENLLVRKCSIHVLGSILKQHKRSHPKHEIETSNEQVKAPGDREGNRWLCYDKTKVGKNIIIILANCRYITVPSLRHRSPKFAYSAFKSVPN